MRANKPKKKMCKAKRCRVRFEQMNSFHVACSVPCSIEIVRDKADKDKKESEKAENKVHAERKRKFYDNDLKTRKKAAKIACHSYIRERDRGLPCICCGRPLGAKFDAGHWKESSNYPSIRYDEDNINAQSVHCNQYKGGDSGDYEKNLRLKIGNEKVDALIAKKNIIIKRTAQDYRDIEEYYKEKLKELQEQAES